MHANILLITVNLEKITTTIITSFITLMITMDNVVKLFVLNNIFG